MKNIFAASAALLTAVAFAEEEKRPNIIFIMADDLGYSELGCYGNTFNETPVLDQMAKDGVRFSHAHTAASLSSPTRAAIMTGQYPYRVGIVDFLRGNSQAMRTDVVTLAEALSESGYQTGIIGKWHLTGYLRSGASSEILPDKRGFKEMILTENQYIGEGSYFHPYNFNRDVPKVLSDENGKEFLVDRLNYEAIDFIKRNKETPFFLYLTHYAVHTKLMGAPETVEYFRQKAGAGTSPPSDSNPYNDPYKKFPADYAASKNNPHLAAQLKHIDTGVGQILDALREQELLENTLVIFTSDNGGAIGVTTNEPLRGGKVNLYEGGTRVPMIFYGYGTEQSPKVIDSRIVSMDFFPTFCELTQTVKPDQVCDGISILPLLKNEKLPERDLFWYYPPSVKIENSARKIEASIVSGDYKLIENYSFDGNNIPVVGRELFNLAEDPYELSEISIDDHDKVMELSEKIKRWKKSIDGDNPSHNMPRIIYVSSDGVGDGSSWSNTASITTAVLVAKENPHHEMWLKEGVYKITSSINFDHLFIYGGFKGDEALLSERNWTENVTILDGDNKISPIRNTIGDDREGGNTTFVPSVVDGVIVQNGLNATGENGGGMIVNNGAFVRNCIFRNNTTTNNKNGGAIHCNYGYCVIENSLFINNTSSGNGGAVQIGGGATVIVKSSTFANNKASRPGGAIGSGTTSSHLTLINTIAYNNLYGSIYNSYGQNSDINSGGNIVSIHSAVETTSSKFFDGDDLNHLVLNRTNAPGFISPATIIGAGRSESQIDEINAASYKLLKESSCIDAGLDFYAIDIPLDLLGKDRVQGFAVDIGVYEYDEEMNSIFTPIGNTHIKAFVAENELYVSGVRRGELLYLYNVRGELEDIKRVINEDNYTTFCLNQRGVYFVLVDQEVIKVRN